MINYEAFQERLDAVWAEYECPDDLKPKIEWSTRLTRASGKFKYHRFKKETRIIMNHKALMAYGEERMMATLNHELAHAILWAKHKITGHSARFKALCSILGGSMNTQMAGRSYRECAETRYLPRKTTVFYECPCGEVIAKGRSYSYWQELRYACSYCGRPLVECRKRKMGGANG